VTLGVSSEGSPPGVTVKEFATTGEPLNGTASDSLGVTGVPVSRVEKTGLDGIAMLRGSSK
jgi:hypothetical protein